MPWAPNNGYEPKKLTLPPTFVDTPETREFRARYYTDVSTADRELGEILDLSRRKLGTNILFLYTSDHGAQWPFGKWNLYDAGIRTPFIAAWPGVIPPGSRSDAMVQWIDLLPTLIEFAGGKPPEGHRRGFLRRCAARQAGRAPRGHLHDAQRRREDERVSHSRTADTGLEVHPESAPRVRPHDAHRPGCGAGDGWRYFREWVVVRENQPDAAAVVKRYNERPREELYDLRADPHEQHNLAADPQQAARLAEMRAQLEAWMKDQGDTLTVFNPPRLLSDPSSYAPVVTEPPVSAPKKQPKKSKARP